MTLPNVAQKKPDTQYLLCDSTNIMSKSWQNKSMTPEIRKGFSLGGRKVETKRTSGACSV